MTFKWWWGWWWWWIGEWPTSLRPRPTQKTKKMPRPPQAVGKILGSFAVANASQTLQNRTKHTQFRQIFAPAAQQNPLSLHNSGLDRDLPPEVELYWGSMGFTQNTPHRCCFTKFHLLSEQLNGTFHLLSNGIPDYRRCMTVTQAETKGNLC